MRHGCVCLGKGQHRRGRQLYRTINRSDKYVTICIYYQYISSVINTLLQVGGLKLMDVFNF